jgi:hypothetical protein
VALLRRRPFAANPWPHPPNHPNPSTSLAGATIQVTEIAIYLGLGANWAALGQYEGWGPLATLAAAVVVPVVWSRQIVEFC